MASVAELVVRVTADTAKARSELDGTASSASKMGQGISKMAAPAAAALLGIGAAAVSAGKAAAEDAQSQALLATAMEKNTGASKGQIAAMEDYISKMSMATGVADDELRPAMSTLLRSTGDAEKSQKALAVAMDVAAATGKSVESVSGAMAKGFAGSTTSLGRLVPGMDAAVLAGGDMNAIMAELADKTGGAAAASADTAAGKMKIMQVAMDEAKESAGAALLPAMAALADILAKAAGWAQDNSKFIQILAGVVAVLAAAVLAVNAAMKVYQATLIVVQAVQKATFLTNPVFLVIAAIVALIAVIVLLWRNSETFRNVVMAVWNAVKAGAQAATQVIRAVWGAVWDFIEGQARGFRDTVVAIFQAVRTVAANVGAGLREIFGNVWGAIKEGAGAMREAVSGAFRTVRETVGTIAGAIREVWSGVMDAIRGSVAGLGAILSGPFNAMKGALDAVVGAVQNLIGWLGRIKVPKINLPNIPGLSSLTAPAAPAVAGRAAAPGVPGALTGRAVASSGASIVVNGALDPEAVARQIRRILAGHDRRVGLA